MGRGNGFPELFTPSPFLVPLCGGSHFLKRRAWHERCEPPALIDNANQRMTFHESRASTE
jgi:hypothetical protein